MIRVFVISPEDDKYNDYFLITDPGNPDFYILVRIDNDRAFIALDQAGNGWFSARTLNVKTIIFCLNQMTLSWQELAKKDPRLKEFYQHLQSLVPRKCFQDILRELSDLHDQWCLLFSKQEVIDAAQKGLKQGDLSLPVMMVLPDCEKALLERLYLIQQALRNPEVSGKSLLEHVQPGLAEYYQHLFKPTLTPLKRFEAGPGLLYQRDQKGHLRTTLSGVLSLSQQLNLSVILKLNSDPRRQKTLIAALVEQIWLKLQYSAAQALGGTEVWYKAKILGIQQGLLATAGMVLDGKKTALTESEAVQRRQEAQLQFQTLLISDRTKLLRELVHTLATTHPPESRQIAALTILEVLTQTPVDCLPLSVFHKELTDDTLIKILHSSGNQLYFLNISNCTLLTERIIPVIETKCPQLRTLRACNMRWETVIVQGLPHLKRLDLSQAQQLRTATLIALPRLERLFLNDCPQLTALADKRFSLTQRPPISLSQLKQINLTGCINLSEIKLVAEQLDESKSYFENCNSQGIVDWLQCIDAKQNNSPSPLLSLAKTALRQETRSLDLASIELDTNNIEWLCRMIRMNLSFRELVLPELDYSRMVWEISKNDQKLHKDDKRLSPKNANINKSISNLEKKSSPNSSSPADSKFWFPPFDVKSLNSQNSNKDFEYFFKFVLVGYCGVGKSSILHRYADNTDYGGMMTIGIDFKIKEIQLEEKNCRLQIWDTAGPNRFRSITTSYFRGAHVIIFCWDDNYENSKSEVEDYLHYIEGMANNAHEYLVKILAHTKCDSEESTEDYCEQVRKYAQEKGLAYFKCSAKKNFGLDEMFEYACREILKVPSIMQERMKTEQLKEKLGTDINQFRWIDSSGLLGKCDYSFQILLLGNSGTGQSALLNRFFYNSFNKIDRYMNSNFETKIVEIDQKKCELRLSVMNILAFLRSIFFRSTRYLKDNDLFIFCWDVGSGYYSNEEYILFGIEEIEKSNLEHIPMIIVQTECDLYGSVDNKNSGLTFANNMNIPFFKCSAKKNQGVDELFLYSTSELIKKNLGNPISNSPVKICREKISDIKEQIFPKIILIIQALRFNDTIQLLNLKNCIGKDIRAELLKVLKTNHSLISIKFDGLDIDIFFKETIYKLLKNNVELAKNKKNPKDIKHSEDYKKEKMGELPICSIQKIFPLSSDISPHYEENLSPITDECGEESKSSTVFEESDTELKASTDKYPFSLLSIINPLAEMKTLDAKNFCHAVTRLSDIPIDSPVQPYKQYLCQLRDRFMHSDSTAMREINEFLRYWCLISQYQQRLNNPVSEDILAQEIIQSHPALTQYHDLLLQTLEFGIKAAMLGVTGHFKTTGFVDTLITGTGAVLGAIPMVGNTLQAPVSGLAVVNQIRMLRIDHCINQLFIGARDVEEKIGQLVVQMTLSIRAELLENKPTPARHEALVKNGVANYYHRAKTFFNQQKVQWVNWQSLSTAQKRALWDADYLLSQMPSMAKTSRYRETTACVSAFLAILMRDPEFKFNFQIINKSPQSQTSSTSGQKRYSDYSSKRLIYLQEMKATAQQPLTEKTHWQNLFDCLGRLEIANLECLSCQTADQSPETVLAQWFDQLLPPAPTEPRLSELVESGYALLSSSPTITSFTSKSTSSLKQN